ncbi:MAG TPA: carbohydrate porin, partial [Nevskiaceae bacterium]|nr:carbohydrate porin [Nevskiaceae bacterium]
RTTLWDYGVDVRPGFLMEYGHNYTGGTRHTDSVVDNEDFRMTVDFHRLSQHLFGWQDWRGTTLHFDMMDRNGTLLDEKAQLGTLYQAQEIFGAGSYFRVPHLYIEQKLWNDLVDIKLGRLDQSIDFFPFSCDFQNLVFCGSGPGHTAHSVTLYPLPQTGGSIIINPTWMWSVKFGAYRNNTSKLGRGGHNGTTTMAEIDLHTRLAGHKDLPGVYSVGGWHNTAQYRLGDSLPGVVTTILAGNPRILAQTSTWGYYVTLQQTVTHNTQGGGLTLFANMTHPDHRTNLISMMATVGGFWKAPLPDRPNDRIDFGLARVSLNHDARALEQLAYATPGSDVTTFASQPSYTAELDYSIDVWHGAWVMPNFQYIVHPGGSLQNKNALVFGLQVGLPL